MITKWDVHRTFSTLVYIGLHTEHFHTEYRKVLYVEITEALIYLVSFICKRPSLGNISTTITFHVGLTKITYWCLVGRERSQMGSLTYLMPWQRWLKEDCWTGHLYINSPAWQSQRSRLLTWHLRAPKGTVPRDMSGSCQYLKAAAQDSIILALLHWSKQIESPPIFKGRGQWH